MGKGKLPEIVCRKCGELKLPKQRCQNCYKAGSYRGRVPALESTVKLVKARQEAKAKRQQEQKNAYAVRRRRGRLDRFVRGVTLLRLMLLEFTGLFEKDRAGNWVIYEENMPALQAAMRKSRVVLDIVSRLEKAPKSEATARQEWEEL